MVFAVVLIAEIVAVTLTLARPAAAFLYELGRVSMFLQWLALTSAAVLCYARPLVARLRAAGVTAAVLGLLTANTALVSFAALWLEGDAGAPQALTGAWQFLLRNEGICVIVTALLLRYFFVEHQWRGKSVPGQLASRRSGEVRPHFLFNSLNTIAALTRSDARAEEAVEDLADLFRATLRDSRARPPLRQGSSSRGCISASSSSGSDACRCSGTWPICRWTRECRASRLALLGARLSASSRSTAAAPSRSWARRRRQDRDRRAGRSRPRAAQGERAGNRLALDSIRERLGLAYGADGALESSGPPIRFKVTVRFPYGV
jgi:two-component system sensor histidine kinase AlgZ